MKIVNKEKTENQVVALSPLQEAQLAHSEAVFAVAVAEEQARPYMEQLENARRGAMEALMAVNELKKQASQPE